MPVANGSAGGNFDALLQLSQRRNPPGARGRQEATRERGQHQTRCREWLSGTNNSPEGLTVTTPISYGCWPRLI
jgi:hypothetical protein